MTPQAALEECLCIVPECEYSGSLEDLEEHLKETHDGYRLILD